MDTPPDISSAALDSAVQLQALPYDVVEQCPVVPGSIASQCHGTPYPRALNNHLSTALPFREMNGKQQRTVPGASSKQSLCLCVKNYCLDGMFLVNESLSSINIYSTNKCADMEGDGISK
jgi:hypothetical protein